MRWTTGAPVVVLALAGAALAGMEAVEDPHAKLYDVGSLINRGQYAEAAIAAEWVVRRIEDPDRKTEAMELLAVAHRKNGDARAAAIAYHELAGRYEDGSREQVRYDAMWEVLRKGIVPEGVKKAAAADGEVVDTGKLLADDSVLEQGLELVGQERAKKLAEQARRVHKFTRAPDAAARFGEIAEGYRQSLILTGDVNLTSVRSAANRLGYRLEAFGREAVKKFEAEEARAKRSIHIQSTVTSWLRKELRERRELCLQLAAAEQGFGDGVGYIGAAGGYSSGGYSSDGWPEQHRLVSESRERQKKYEEFAETYLALMYSDKGGEYASELKKSKTD